GRPEPFPSGGGDPGRQRGEAPPGPAVLGPDLPRRRQRPCGSGGDRPSWRPAGGSAADRWPLLSGRPAAEADEGGARSTDRQGARLPDRAGGRVGDPAPPACARGRTGGGGDRDGDASAPKGTL
ncbi:MAG: hypothetical protein AVDCRST_MAG19-644, partial [uncultured Thermomicrobiales bacterium]